MQLKREARNRKKLLKMLYLWADNFSYLPKMKNLKAKMLYINNEILNL